MSRSVTADTEKQLLKNLRNLTDKTVVIVTHRPAVLSICDRILRFTEDPEPGKPILSTEK